jgi:hypothetical protein
VQQHLLDLEPISQDSGRAGMDSRFDLDPCRIASMAVAAFS